VIDPAAAVDAANTAAIVSPTGGDDVSLLVLMVAEHAPNFLLAAIVLAVLYKLLGREQTARDAANKDLVDTLKLERAAIGKLETAITGLSSEVSGLRRDHATLQRGQEEIKTRVETHASRLDDHERRIMAYEYSEPAAAAPRQRRPAQGNA